MLALEHFTSSTDMPLLSPITCSSNPWEDDQDSHHSFHNFDSYLHNDGDDDDTTYEDLSPSPPASSSGSGSPSSDFHSSDFGMLGLRRSSEGSENEGLCVATHQVFDLPEGSSTPPPPPPASLTPAPSSSCPSPKASPVARPMSVGPPSESFIDPPKTACAKRAADPSTNPAKKVRSSGERIRAKDFVPPDITGLSKREARLVKNRAAAFLSRQRKREEFELMEAYVRRLLLPPSASELDVISQASGSTRGGKLPAASLG
jgi:hypothetical protein